MFSPSKFRELVSGQTRGRKASLMRLGLALIEPVYTRAVRWRNRHFDRNPALVRQVPVPVISVGNITLGGTGKTPLVEWIARQLIDQGQRVVIVSRGYGQLKTDRGEGEAKNDEALELAQRLPGVPHLQNPDRVAAAMQAIQDFAAGVIVLDDGFQHRRIGRDLDIVLLDALEPFGFGHVFPRGALREPLSGLQRAQVVMLSRADLLSPADREEIHHQVVCYAPRALWAEAVHAPRMLLSSDGRHETIESLTGKKVAAFCGIGNPAGFRHTLEICGYQVVAFREFPDHHAYTPADQQSLADWASELEVAAVLCTHKDLVKLPGTTVGSRPLWAVGIGLKFLAGEQEFRQRLQKAVELTRRHGSAEGER